MVHIRIQGSNNGEQTALIEQRDELDKCVKIYKRAICAVFSASMVMLLAGTIILGSSKSDINKQNAGSFLISLAIAGVLGSIIVCIGTKCHHRREERRLEGEGL